MPTKKVAAVPITARQGYAIHRAVASAEGAVIEARQLCADRPGFLGIKQQRALGRLYKAAQQMLEMTAQAKGVKLRVLTGACPCCRDRCWQYCCCSGLSGHGLAGVNPRA